MSIRSVVSKFLGLALLGFAALLPVCITSQVVNAGSAADDDFANSPQPDIFGRAQMRPNSLEWDESLNYWMPRDAGALKKAPCNALCQTLLLQREVKFVTVVNGDNWVVYSYAERRDCPAAFEHGADALPSTRRAAAEGRCLIAEVKTAPRAEAKIVSRIGSNGHDGIKRLEAFVVNGDWRIIARRTREQHNDAVKDPMKFARESLGFSLQPPEASVDVSRDLIERVLARRDRSPFPPELSQLIDDYFRQIGSNPSHQTAYAFGEFEEADVSLTRRLLKDARLRDHFSIRIALEHQPKALASLIPEILDLLERPETTGLEHNGLAWLIARYAPLDSLKPFERRILKLAEAPYGGPSKSYAPNVIPLLSVVGVFDHDPTALLRSKLKSLDPEIRLLAAAAICRADEKWGRALSGDLRGLLSMSGPDYADAEDVLEAVRGLNRWGQQAEVEKFLALGREKDSERIRRNARRGRLDDKGPC